MEICVLRQAVLALKGPSLQYSTVHRHIERSCGQTHRVYTLLDRQVLADQIKHYRSA
jgi:hypothetical protein